MADNKDCKYKPELLVGVREFMSTTTNTDAKCPTSKTGKHEPDLEGLEFEVYISAREGRFETDCIHCGKRGETLIHFSDFDWIGEL